MKKMSKALIAVVVLAMITLSGCGSDEISLLKAVLKTQAEVTSGKSEMNLAVSISPKNEDVMLPVRELNVSSVSEYSKSEDGKVLKAHVNMDIDVSEIKTKLNCWADMDLRGDNPKYNLILKSPKFITNIFAGNSKTVEYINMDIFKMQKNQNNPINSITPITPFNPIGNLVAPEKMANFITDGNSISKILNEELADKFIDFSTDVSVKKETMPDTGNVKYSLQLDEQKTLSFLRDFAKYVVENDVKFKETFKEILALFGKYITGSNDQVADTLSQIDKQIPLTNIVKNELLSKIDEIYADALKNIKNENVKFVSNIVFIVNKEGVVVGNAIDINLDIPWGEIKIKFDNTVTKYNDGIEVAVPTLTSTNSVDMEKYMEMQAKKAEEQRKKWELESDRNQSDMGIIGIKVDGNRVYFYDVQPKIINGRVMVPARTLIEHMGGIMNWDQKTSTSEGTLGDKRITFNPQKNEVLINGLKAQYDVVVRDGRTLVSARAIGEAFGAKVGWNEEYKYVTINVLKAQ